MREPLVLSRAVQLGRDQEERGVVRVEPRVFVAAVLPRAAKIWTEWAERTSERTGAAFGAVVQRRDARILSILFRFAAALHEPLCIVLRMGM